MLFLRVKESLFICKKQKLKMKAELKTAKGPVSLTGEIKVIIGNSLVVVIHDARMLTHPKLETEQQTCIVVCHAITCLSKKYLLLGFVCLFVLPLNLQT